MKKTFYLYIFVLCFALLGAALWLQHLGYSGVNFAPCPLCILQRIGYLGIAVACLFAYGFDRYRKLFHSIAILFSLFGLSMSIRQMSVIANPNTSCGIDPLEVLINQSALTQYVPWFFKADGFCSAPLPPLLGISVPVWSLIWLSFFTGVLLISFFLKLSKSSRA